MSIELDIAPGNGTTYIEHEIPIDPEKISPEFFILVGLPESAINIRVVCDIPATDEEAE